MEILNENDEVALEIMTRAKMQLDGINPINQNNEYNNIVNLVNEYLMKHCNHTIISDTIDISDTLSKTVYYCQHCGVTVKCP